MRYPSFLAVMLLSAEAFAGSARASLDRGRASLDDEVTLTIQVVGSAETPELPSSMSADFEVQSSGQSNQVSIINGRMSSSTRYTFTLVPKHAGTLTVPSIPVLVDGTRMSTEPVQLFVAAASASPGKGGEEIYITAELVPASGPRQSAFVGEQLVYTLKVWARVDASCPSLKLPDFPNAASYDLGEQRQYRTHLDGEDVSVVEVRKAVFADKAGMLELAPVRLNCTLERNRRRGDDFGSIFGSNGVRKVVRSNAPRLSIEALPPAPPGFSGLVGEVTVSAALSKSEAHTGDSVTLSLAVRGNGDMSAAPEPRIPFGGSVKVYDDKPTLRYDSTGESLVGERVFQKALVAQSASDIVIPAPSIVYFDPKRRGYATAEAHPLTLRIVGAHLPVAAIAPPPATGEAARPREEPGRPARRSAFTLRRSSGGLAGWLAGPRLALLVVAPLVAAGLVRSRRARSGSGAQRRQRRDAAQRALRDLRELGNDARQVSRVVRELIGTRVQHHGAALSSDEALQALAASGLDAALVQRARAVLGACDAALYGNAGAEGDLKEDAIALARAFVEAA